MKKYHITYILTAALICAAVSGCAAGTASETAESASVTEAAEPAQSKEPTEPTEPKEPAEPKDPALPKEPAEPNLPSISAHWAEGTETAEYSAESDCNATVTLTSTETVTDFKLLSLTFVDFDEHGKIIYDISELYTREELSSDSPLTVAVPFSEVIPNIGFSYTDNAGEFQRYTLSESGYDGSLVISSF